MTAECHAERGCMQANSASLVKKGIPNQVRDDSGDRFGMSRGVMLNLFQHLLHRGDPESSSG